jgi:very-short-patch-repair endonuclease
MNKCKICNNEFESKNPNRPAKTCSKQCKNELARQITNRQFEDPVAREIQRQKTLANLRDPMYIENQRRGIENRTKRWAKQGHPRLGMIQPKSCNIKIGNANRGRFKGKSWEEIYGPEVAQRRRKENSLAMSKKNEILLTDRRSKLEDRLLPYLPDYKNNIQINHYTVDFINEETKHIIEVHGDYWHCNPTIYSENFINKTGITAKEKWNKDTDRKMYLESQGYKVTIVWESDLLEFIKTL